MTDKQIMKELVSIISYAGILKDNADELKFKAAGLRKKLERFYVPASPYRGKKVLSEEVIAKVLKGRQNFRNRKAIAKTMARR